MPQKVDRHMYACEVIASQFPKPHPDFSDQLCHHLLWPSDVLGLMVTEENLLCYQERIPLVLVPLEDKPMKMGQFP